MFFHQQEHKHYCVYKNQHYKIDDYFVETILRKYEQRLYYLGGLADLVRGVVVDIEAFTALMDLVKHQFNYVLLDAQRDLSPINRVCMSRADCFLIMVEMTLASAQNTARLLEFLTTDQGGKKVTIVANKVGLSASSCCIGGCKYRATVSDVWWSAY